MGWRKSLIGNRRGGPAEDDDTVCEHQPNKPFSVGIKRLYDPEDSNIDIVFVHGLTGDRDATWTARDATEPWPKVLLPPMLPKARILTFGYDADVGSWERVVSQNRIKDHSWNLLVSLSRCRDNEETNERPIIFVCHSLGGLVCEDALTKSKQRSERHLRNVFDSTRGVMFLGTPHHGAGLAQLAEVLSRYIGLIKKMNSDLLSVLRRDSEVLARIQDEFHTMVKARKEERRQPIEITCFYEELPLGRLGLVVPKDSALLPGEIPIGIHSDHINMTKFARADDPGFEAVCGELKRWITNAAKESLFSYQTPDQSSNTLEETIKQNCLSDLCLTDPDEDKNELKRRKGNRASGTCEWIFSTEALKTWLGTGQGVLLWLYGYPGTGKSTMAIFLSEQLLAEFSRPDVGKTAAYFFCDSGNDKRKTATSVIRGLLLQLVRQQPQLLYYVLPKYKSRGKQLFESFDALWSVFMAAVADQNTGRKYFIIDALDECDRESQDILLRQFEASFSSMENWNIRILVTSRPYSDIDRYLKRFANKDLASYPQRQKDIERYIEDKIEYLAKRNDYTGNVRMKVRNLLQEKAEGTFLWVGLVFEELRCTRSKEAVQVLNSLPPGLDLLYEKLLNKAFESKEAGGDLIRILKFVALSVRPLSVLELSEVCQLNVDADDMETREQFTREDIASCFFMVIVQDEKVLLLHRSVREHLEKADYFDELEVHADFAYRCIDLLINPPAYSSLYATENWPTHASLAQSKFVIRDSQAKFFDIDSSYRERWLDRLRRESSLRPQLPRDFSLLHIAARWGLPTLARHAYYKAAEMNCLDIAHRVSSNGMTPLELAVGSRDPGVVSVLLEFKGKLTTKVLTAAAGNEEAGQDMMALLLRHCKSHFTIHEEVVKTAARNRRSGEGVVKLLLEHLGDKITMNKDVAIAAAGNWEGADRVMRLLLDHQRDQVEIDEEVFIAAARNRGNAKGVMKLLLEHRPMFMITPKVVKAAAENWWNAVGLMTLLLSCRGDQIEITSDIVKAAAGNWGNGKGVLELLLDRQGEQLKIDQDVVIAAAENRGDGEAVIKLLLKCRSTQVMVTKEVLKAAVRNRNSAEGVVKLLLGHQAQVTISDEVFKAAAKNVNQNTADEVIKLLRRHISEENNHRFLAG